jgi:hypothetical protein
MSTRRDDLEQAYRTVLGKRLSNLAWMPLTSYTPDLVRTFESPSFSFSGGIQFWFEPEGELFLSWGQRAPPTLIASTESDRWLPNVLDRISASMVGPWPQAIDARLVAVDFFLAPEADPLEGAEESLRSAPVGARHWLQHGDTLHRFWAGTGDCAGLGESDDLWVGIDQDPENFDELMLLETLRA